MSTLLDGARAGASVVELCSFIDRALDGMIEIVETLGDLAEDFALALELRFLLAEALQLLALVLRQRSRQRVVGLAVPLTPNPVAKRPLVDPKVACDGDEGLVGREHAADGLCLELRREPQPLAGRGRVRGAAAARAGGTRDPLSAPALRSGARRLFRTSERTGMASTVSGAVKVYFCARC